MRRGVLTHLVLAATVSACLVARPGRAAQPSPGKVGLKVLYVGYPETPRQKDFVGFLEQHFAKVGQGDLDKFGEQDVEGYDVVILDYGELKIAGNRIVSPKAPVGQGYSRPTVTIGATGGLVCGMLKLKTGYL